MAGGPGREKKRKLKKGFYFTKKEKVYKIEFNMEKIEKKIYENTVELKHNQTKKMHRHECNKTSLSLRYVLNILKLFLLKPMIE